MRSREPEGIVRGTKRIILVMCRGTGLTPHRDSEVGLVGRGVSDNSPERVARIELGTVDSWIHPTVGQFMEDVAGVFDAAIIGVGMAPSCAEVCDR